MPVALPAKAHLALGDLDPDPQAPDRGDHHPAATSRHEQADQGEQAVGDGVRSLVPDHARTGHVLIGRQGEIEDHRHRGEEHCKADGAGDEGAN